MRVGIEAMNFYGGSAYIDIEKLAEHRKLDTQRFQNLLLKEKSVPLPYEDPITFGVNAAKPIIDQLSEEEKNSIDMVISCTESGIDFGKSLSTYIHDYLDLSRNCRLFELKNACYSGTAGLQLAIEFVLSGVSPGAKVLVVATDMARFVATDPGEALMADWSFAEPSGGAGAVALLISDKPDIYTVDVGANGYYGYEIMDTCRPVPDSESGNADSSLMSYLDCCLAAYQEYEKRVAGVEYATTFQYLAFHVPFGGMVKGAHRTMMRKLYRMGGAEVEKDFEQRVQPGLTYCQRVGNIMGATVLLSLISIIENGTFDNPKRLGCFSYGSGCCSEFYSGVVDASGKEKLGKMNIVKHLESRLELSMSQYDYLLSGNGAVAFGTRNVDLDLNIIPEVRRVLEGSNKLVLKRIHEYHREYIWI